MTKPKIEVLPIEKAPWVQDWMINTGINFTYRITSPYQSDNQIIGAREGSRKDVEDYAKKIAKRFLCNVEAMHRGRAKINMGANKTPQHLGEL